MRRRLYELTCANPIVLAVFVADLSLSLVLTELGSARAPLVSTCTQDKTNRRFDLERRPFTRTTPHTHQADITMSLLRRAVHIAARRAAASHATINTSTAAVAHSHFTPAFAIAWSEEKAETRQTRGAMTLY